MTDLSGQSSKFNPIAFYLHESATAKADCLHGRTVQQVKAILVAGLAAAGLACGWTSAQAATLAIGYRVVATATSTPRTTPNGTQSPLGSQRIGVLGTIIDGPVSAGGSEWWNVDFEVGADGWATDQSIDQPYSRRPTRKAAGGPSWRSTDADGRPEKRHPDQDRHRLGQADVGERV